MHTVANQPLLKYITAYPVILILALETVKNRGVFGTSVAVRHLSPKSALLSLSLCLLAAPWEGGNGRQKAQLYTSIPLKPLVIEKSESNLAEKIQKSS